MKKTHAYPPIHAKPPLSQKVKEGSLFISPSDVVKGNNSNSIIKDEEFSTAVKEEHKQKYDDAAQVTQYREDEMGSGLIEPQETLRQPLDNQEESKTTQDGPADGQDFADDVEF